MSDIIRILTLMISAVYIVCSLLTIYCFSWGLAISICLLEAVLCHYFLYYRNVNQTFAKGSKERDIELLRLQNEIHELKQELEAARIKNVVLETLVDVAEREFHIPIRKKYGAKRSGR
jgi:hypothetical protein